MNQLESTALHEAAHGVAVGLRGGRVHEITLVPGETKFALPGNGYKFSGGEIVQRPSTGPTPSTLAHAFVAMAGSWADVRAVSNGPVDPAVVLAVLENQVSDYDICAQVAGWDAQIDQWCAELEDHLSAIVDLARKLLREHADRVASQRRRRSRRKIGVKPR